MEVEEPCKIGFLFTPPQSFLRKSWAKRFCALYKASSHGIQRLEIFDNDTAFLKQSKSPSKIIPLTDCVKVTPAPQKQQSNVFEVRTKSCSYQFSADSFQEMAEWLSTLQAVAFGPVFKANQSLAQCVVQDVKQEENMLYSSMDEPEVYSVRSLNTDAMLRNNLHGEYKLIITSVGICLAEDNIQNKAGKAILTWPYRHIRRYGCSKDNFSFEAGRKSSSGEGLFAFSSSDGSLVFQSVDAHVASLKLSQSDSDTPISPICEDDKIPVFVFKEDASKANANHDAFSNINAISVKKNMSPNQVVKDKSEKVDEGEKDVHRGPHPVSKPPRKSKAGTYINFTREKDDVGSKSSSHIDDNIRSQSNIYEDPLDQEFCSPQSGLDVSSERQIHSTYEPVYAVLEAEHVNAFNMKPLTNEIEQINNNDSNIANKSVQLIRHHHNNRESDAYDHLSLKKFDYSRSTRNNPSEHVYGKLLACRPTSAEPTAGFSYSSLKGNQQGVNIQNNPSNTAHCYTNVEKSDSKHCDTFDSGPRHFLQNDAEYARVNKNKK